MRVGFVEMHQVRTPVTSPPAYSSNFYIQNTSNPYSLLLQSFGRSLAPTSGVYFGAALNQIAHNEGGDIPILLRRLLEEIERRGIDSNGMYLRT